MLRFNRLLPEHSKQKRLFIRALLVGMLCLLQGAGMVLAKVQGLPFCNRNDSLIALIKTKSVTDSSFARLCMQISFYHTICNNADHPYYTARLARRVALWYPLDTGLQIKTLIMLSRTQIIKGHMDSVLAIVDTLHQYERYQKWSFISGILLSRRATIYYRRGAYDSAIALAHRAIQKLKQVPDYYNLTGVYSLLGIASGYSLGAEKVLKYQELSAYYARKAGFRHGVMAALCNAAEIYKNSGNYDRAIQCIQEAAAEARAINLKPPSDYTGLDLAELYSLKKDCPSAVKYAEKYQTELDRVELPPANIPYLFAETYRGLSNVYYECGKYPQAMQASKRALALLKLKKEQNALIYVYTALSRIAKAQRNFALALKYADSSAVLNVAQKTQEQIRTVNDIESKYSNLEKQAEIERLTKNGTLQQMALRQQRIFVRLYWAVGFLFVVLIVMMVVLYRRNTFKSSHLHKQLQAENELNQANKELNETRDRFFGLMATDLRAPILQFQSLTLLYEKALQADKKEKISELNTLFRDSVENMLQILDSLTELSVPDRQTGRQGFSMVTLSLFTDDLITAARLQPENKATDFINEVAAHIRVAVPKNSLRGALLQLASLLSGQPKNYLTIRFSGTLYAGTCTLSLSADGLLNPSEAAAKLTEAINVWNQQGGQVPPTTTPDFRPFFNSLASLENKVPVQAFCLGNILLISFELSMEQPVRALNLQAAGT